MNLKPANIRHYTSGTYMLELALSADEVASGFHSGSCDNDIETLRRKPYIESQLKQIDAAKLRLELQEYGAWDASELADHDANLSRFLWLACGELSDEELCDCGESPDGENVPHWQCYTECDGCNKDIPYNWEYCGDCSVKYRGQDETC